MNTRSRNWVLTFNYKECKQMSDEELKDLFLSTNPLCFIFQLEKGKEGTFHHQCAIGYENAKSFETMKKLFPKAHIAEMLGTWKENIVYCSKNDETKVGETITFGEFPINQGKRNDIKEVVDMLRSGCSLIDVLEEHTSTYVRNKHSIDSIVSDLRYEEYKHKNRNNIEVYYIYGVTGCGKTRYVEEEYGEDMYRITDYKHPFDNYSGQSVIAFDEFREDIPINQMLAYLERYPVQLSARYNNKWACYTKVFIISNWRFDEQYKDSQTNDIRTYEAWKRRFTYYGKLEDVKKYIKEKQEKEVLEKQGLYKVKVNEINTFHGGKVGEDSYYTEIESDNIKEDIDINKKVISSDYIKDDDLPF